MTAPAHALTRVWAVVLVVVAMLAVTGAAVRGMDRAGHVPDEPAPVEAQSAPAAPADAPAPAPTPAAAPTPGPTPAAAPTPALTPAAAPTPATAATPTPAPTPDRLQPFVGLSTWIDVYDIEWTPQQQVAVAADAGVQAIYVQSARHVSPGHIHDPDRLAGVIEAAHDRSMQVMVWYIPDLVDPAKDLARAKAAIAFTTPHGDRADAFGLDIELEDEPDVALRTRRLLDLSRDLREWVGPDYPLAAVVLPPLQLDLRPSWWPDFPYDRLRAYYDVFVPMSYSSFRGTDEETTYAWNLDNVRELRRRSGDPELPVHLAGGIADDLPHVAAFVRAAAEADVLGAGLYDLHTTPPSAWPELRPLRRP